jgi:hypothetical protein
MNILSLFTQKEHEDFLFIKTNKKVKPAEVG